MEGTDGTGNLFMGPAMFTTDRTIFAKRVTGLGSHYDMLHQTPFCRGIAHETANVYWTFNAFDSSIDKYNFNKDHGPGEDDHSDGEIYRYVPGKVKGAEDGTPSHLVLDPNDQFLYVADTGNGRIVRLDTTKGEKTGELERYNEDLKDSGLMTGVDLEVVVPPGVLEKPSGIEVKNDLLYVTDAATSTFHVFQKDGTEVRKLSTGLPAGALAGFTFGPDDKIWFTDKVGGKVLRIDPNP
jgi:sugar lactone lactonase YvrE